MVLLHDEKLKIEGEKLKLEDSVNAHASHVTELHQRIELMQAHIDNLNKTHEQHLALLQQQGSSMKRDFF